MRPGKATESDILAWIEGELPEDRAGAVEAAFVEDPSLRAWAASMRGDRAMLCAWAVDAVRMAPKGLAESALERVERDALLGPSEAEALAMAPGRESPAVAHRIRRYATAAAVALLVGVIAVTGVRLGLNNGGLGGGEHTMIVRGPDAGERAGEMASISVLGPGEAMTDPHDDLLDAVRRDRGGMSAGSIGEDALEPGTGLRRDETKPATGLAMGLAMGPEAGAGAERSGDNDSDERFEIRPLDKPTGFAELIGMLLGDAVIAGGPVIPISPEQASLPEVRDRVVVRAWSDDPIALIEAMRTLTGAPGSPAAGWHQVTGGPEDGASPVDGEVCTVSLPGESAGFAWFIDALRRAGASRVELTLRDGSAPESAPGRITDAAGALWWGEPIRVWAGWARVPVLISPTGAAPGMAPPSE
jgi:hypothetical protein